MYVYIKLIHSILHCLLRMIAMEFCYEKSVSCGLIFLCIPQVVRSCSVL